MLWWKEARVMKRMRAASCFPAVFSIASLLILLVMHQPSHADEPSVVLNREHASAFARLALKGLSKEYPNKPEHVLAGPADVKAPLALHPAFYGSYDWHSSVHGHWMLVRLLRLFPDLKEAAEIRAVLGAHLTAENLKVEADYFARKESKSFERPYGWAWLLKLAQELNGWDDPDGKVWAKNLRPLADVVVVRYLEFFPKQTYPIRTGVHPNTAFGLSFAHDYARSVGDTRLDWAGGGASQGLLRRRRRRAGRVGAGRGGLLLAEPDGGRPDAPGAPGRPSSGRGSRGSCRGRPKASRGHCLSPRR